MSLRRMFGILSVTALATAFAPTLDAQAKTDWPSYNGSLSSTRYSTLTAIDASNVGKLSVICTFNTKETNAFKSGLVEIDGALFATTEHDTFSINPNTCKLNWRAHENFPNSFLGAQRGVAVSDGRVFRGSRNGHVYAYDEKTGAHLWDTTIADMKKGKSTPSAPIVWKGLVFIGTAGGDNRGVKGRMYALDAATGKVVWEYYLVPRAPGDPERGPEGKPGAPASTWKNAPGIEITGGGTWTSYSLDAARGEIYVPGGNPAPDFIKGLHKGANLYAGSIVVLDARTGDYKRHYSIVPGDFHDYDVSSAPVLFTSKNGTKIMALTPKDGFLYAYDLTSGRKLYRVPMTTQFNTQTPMSAKGVRFCPGTDGGSEWNGPAYDKAHDAILSGQVDWCSTVHIDDSAKTKAVATGQPWSGSTKDGFGIQDPQSKWAGWLTSVNAMSGKQRWQFKAPDPIVSGVAPTAGDVVFFGDIGGHFFALNSDTGTKLGQ